MYTLASLMTYATSSLVANLVEQSVGLAPRQAASLCDQYSYYAANGYKFNNNNWGKGSATSGGQCITVDSTSNYGVKWSTMWAWQGRQDNVTRLTSSSPRGSYLIGKIKSMPTNLQ